MLNVMEANSDFLQRVAIQRFEKTVGKITSTVEILSSRGRKSSVESVQCKYFGCFAVFMQCMLFFSIDSIEISVGNNSNLCNIQ